MSDGYKSSIQFLRLLCKFGLRLVILICLNANGLVNICGLVYVNSVLLGQYGDSKDLMSFNDCLA